MKRLRNQHAAYTNRYAALKKGDMSVRVSFYTHSSDTFEELILGEYAKFRTWVLDTDPWSFPNNQELERAHLVLLNFILDNEAIQTLDYLPKDLTDQLTGNFIGDYCDYGPGKGLLNYLGSLINIQNYQKDINFIVDKEIHSLWQFILHGRSIHQDGYFHPINLGHFKVGYWTNQEKMIVSEGLDKFYKRNSDMHGIGAVFDVLKKTEHLKNDLLFTVA